MLLYKDRPHELDVRTSADISFRLVQTCSALPSYEAPPLLKSRIGDDSCEASFASSTLLVMRQPFNRCEMLQCEAKALRWCRVKFWSLTAFL